VKRVASLAVKILSCLFAVLFLAISIEIAAGWRCRLLAEIPLPAQSVASGNSAKYARPEDDTYLSYPEWYIVWSYQEKADLQRTSLPSSFPFFAAVRQYWSSYCCINRLIDGKYPFNVGEHVMLIVIGTSFSAEYIVKGTYENTVGRISEWTSRHELTDEDRFAARVASDYADFVHVRPFYEYRFARQVPALWRETSMFGPCILRKWERKLFLSVDYTVEGVYSAFIQELTHLTFGIDDQQTVASLAANDQARVESVPHVKVVDKEDNGTFIVAIPRYQEFTSISAQLAALDVQFVTIAGNSRIAVSLIAPDSWSSDPALSRLLFKQPVLTHPGLQRSYVVCSVPNLDALLRNAASGSATLEHVYDY
jgi:hypothetical protein